MSGVMKEYEVVCMDCKKKCGRINLPTWVKQGEYAIVTLRQTIPLLWHWIERNNSKVYKFMEDHEGHYSLIRRVYHV